MAFLSSLLGYVQQSRRGQRQWTNLVRVAFENAVPRTFLRKESAMSRRLTVVLCVLAAGVLVAAQAVAQEIKADVLARANTSALISWATA